MVYTHGTNIFTDTALRCIMTRRQNCEMQTYCKYGKIAYWLHLRDNESYADEWKAFRLCR